MRTTACAGLACVVHVALMTLASRRAPFTLFLVNPGAVTNGT